ncbi:SDR family oxidoreductase [Streptomyces sp. SP18ES09]|uniref:SDR family oxidoreductase n=1 Tax=Streptomyces sp. SP18ES09 TaxID=3002532 RepID=UPI002E774D3E|nr:SDR family oxidoreductase [Streptomyces sp. SP18ES09]MEE1817581.1 SDR family oxidoreductase [Streptomyces sp. SP18ES09]
MTKPLVVVTGASSGIGAATARLLSAQGHPLLLLARRLERLEALDLPQALCRKVDVTDRPRVDEAVREAQERFGPADAIVNNAGAMLLGRVADQPVEEWDRMIDLNIKGVLYGTRAVLPGMLGRRAGTIINVSSIAGRKTFPHHAAYVATKFAVHALSENLREEVAATGVRVVTIAPGAVETELLSHTSSEEIKSDYQAWKEAAGGALDPQVVAEAILYAYRQPPNVTVREIVLAATGQEG